MGSTVECFCIVHKYCFIFCGSVFSHGVTMTLRNIIGAMFQIMACTSMSSFRTSGLKICCALSLGELTIKGFLGLTISQFSLKYFVHLLD